MGLYMKYIAGNRLYIYINAAKLFFDESCVWQTRRLWQLTSMWRRPILSLYTFVIIIYYYYCIVLQWRKPGSPVHPVS